MSKMMNPHDEKLWEICKEIYRELYKQANPSADFDELIKTGESKKDQFFMKYYLEIEKQENIIKLICRKHKLDRWDKHHVTKTIYLGSSPNSCEKTWKDAWRDKP